MHENKPVPGDEAPTRDPLSIIADPDTEEHEWVKAAEMLQSTAQSSPPNESSKHKATHARSRKPLFALLAIAFSCFLTNRALLYVGHAERIAEHVDNAAKILTAATWLCPVSADTFVELAQAQLAQKSYEAARQSATRAIELSPRNATAFAVRATAEMCIEDFSRPQILADAATAFELEETLFTVETYGIAINTYSQLHPDRLSKQILQRAVQMGTHNEFIFVALGLLQLNERNYASAIENFSRSLSIASDDPQVWQWRAEAYVGVNDRDAAARDYDTAIAKAQKFLPLALPGLLAARAENRVRDLDLKGALSDIEAALHSGDYAYGDWIRTKGRAQLGLGEFDAALQTLRVAEKRMPVFDSDHSLAEAEAIAGHRAAALKVAAEANYAVPAYTKNEILQLNDMKTLKHTRAIDQWLKSVKETVEARCKRTATKEPFQINLIFSVDKDARIIEPHILGSNGSQNDNLNVYWALAEARLPAPPKGIDETQPITLSFYSMGKPTGGDMFVTFSGAPSTHLNAVCDVFYAD